MLLIKFLLKIKADIRDWYHNYRKVIRLESKYNCSISSKSTFTGPIENIEIGQNTRINKFSNFRFKNGNIFIGNNVIIAQYVSVITHSYNYQSNENIKDQPMYSKDVLIGDGCWIGAYSVIMPGVSIGEGAIIGAHSLVNKNVPENEIWGGIPAKKIKVR